MLIDCTRQSPKRSDSPSSRGRRGRESTSLPLSRLPAGFSSRLQTFFRRLLSFPSTTVYSNEPVINLICPGRSRGRVSLTHRNYRAVMKPVLRFSWNRSQAVRILPLLLSPQSPRSRNSGIVIPLMVSLETHDRHKCRLRILVVTLVCILFLITHFSVSHVCETGYA
jgi:hypothetical protein